MKFFTLFICLTFVAFAAARFTASSGEHKRYAAPMGNEEVPEPPQGMHPDHYRNRRQAIKNNEELPEEPARFENELPQRMRTRRAAHVMTEELPEDAQVNFEQHRRRMVRYAQYMPAPPPPPMPDDNMPMPPMPAQIQ